MHNGSAGTLLRQARQRARISQASVAALMGASQTRVSRWESGEIELLDHQLDEALAICGAQRTGPRSLSDLLTPTAGEEELAWFGLQPPLDRIRIAALHCSAAGRPLAGVSWEALRGALTLVVGTPECAISGVVARAVRSPGRTNDHDIDVLDLRARPASRAWSLPSRLTSMQIRVTQIDESEPHRWSPWPTPKGWPGKLVFDFEDAVRSSDVQGDLERGRTPP